MADEFDGCECVWSPEFAMQRLLNFIRQNQDHCTDTECIDVSGRVAPQGDALATMGNDTNNYLMLTLCLTLAVIMFFIRPETIMNITGSKPRGPRRHRDNDENGHPPPPPAIN